MYIKNYKLNLHICLMFSASFPCNSVFTPQSVQYENDII